jgi:hypothetical protein
VFDPHSDLHRPSIDLSIVAEVDFELVDLGLL